MDKHGRLVSITGAVDENKEKEAQALYGVELALKMREWSHALKCVEKLIAIESLNSILNSEAKQLQSEIEQEKEKEILEEIT